MSLLELLFIIIIIVNFIFLLCLTILLLFQFKTKKRKEKIISISETKYKELKKILDKNDITYPGNISRKKLLKIIYDEMDKLNLEIESDKVENNTLN